MHRTLHGLLFTSLLLLASHADAEMSFAVSPSAGSASISNFSSFSNSNYGRVDGSFYLIPQLGFNVFASSYSGFKSTSGNSVTVQISGVGAGVTGRWPIHPNVQPYVRIEYMSWNVEANGLGTTLGKESGGSPGLAAGVHFPIKGFFGLKAEVSGYNKVSDANIRQFSVGAIFEF